MTPPNKPQAEPAKRTWVITKDSDGMIVDGLRCESEWVISMEYHEAVVAKLEAEIKQLRGANATKNTKL